MNTWSTTPGPPLIVSGNPPKVLGGIPSAYLIVDGRLLDKYKNKFELMAVVYHDINNESYMDKTGISKSNLVKIRAEDIPITISFNSQFLAELEMGATAPSFALLAVPKGLRPSDFDTLNEAEEKGAQIIGQGTSFSSPSIITPANPTNQ